MNPCALGWDNHRKFSKVSLMEQTPEGDIRAVERARLEHSDKQAMRAWLSHLDPEIPVALEATFGWPISWKSWDIPSHLAHPPVIRALAKHEAKTDRCDGDRLGKFQLRGILPESYLAPPEVRQRRERTRYRMALSALRTAVKNRAQAVLHRHGILHDFSDLFGKAGRRFLDELALPEGSRQALHGCLQLLDSLGSLIEEVNPRNPQLRRQHCARTSPATLWSAAGQPSARPACNWAVRCRIPILCRAVSNENVPVASGCPNT